MENDNGGAGGIMERKGIFDFAKVKERRIEKNMTLKQLAKLTNTPLKTLEYEEARKHNTNNILMVNKIALVLDCYLDDLVYDGVLLR